jgi:hypothetical protein
MSKHALLLTTVILLATAGYSQSATDTITNTTATDSSSVTITAPPAATETDTIPSSNGNNTIPASTDSTNNATGNPLFKNNVQNNSPQSSNDLRASQPATDSTGKKHKQENTSDQ